MLIPAWLIITGIVILIFIILFKSMNNIYVLSWIKDNFFWFFLIALLIFFTFSLTKVSKSNNLDFSTKDGLMHAGTTYLSWLGNVVGNLGKVTGYAVQQDWTSVNLNNTNSTLKK